MTARVRKNKCPCTSSDGRSKTWYRNSGAARAARDTSRQRAVQAGAPAPQLRIYRCHTTAGWHLTSRPPAEGDTTPPRSGHSAA